MVFIILACLLGVAVGMWAPVIPYEFAKYSAIAIVAAFDSIVGAINSVLKKSFNIKIFVSGFFVNAIIAILLTYLGDRLDTNIFLAAIFVFITRIFNNFSSIRRQLIAKAEEKKAAKEAQKEETKEESKEAENNA